MARNRGGRTTSYNASKYAHAVRQQCKTLGHSFPGRHKKLIHWLEKRQLDLTMQQQQDLEDSGRLELFNVEKQLEQAKQEEAAAQQTAQEVKERFEAAGKEIKGKKSTRDLLTRLHHKIDSIDTKNMNANQLRKLARLQHDADRPNADGPAVTRLIQEVEAWKRKLKRSGIRKAEMALREKGKVKNREMSARLRSVLNAHDRGSETEQAFGTSSVSKSVSRMAIQESSSQNLSLPIRSRPI